MGTTNDKDLRSLGRKELVDIIYEYQKREAYLQKQIKSLSDKLKIKEIQMGEAGSIAEAALALNGVFEAAQAAADQYLCSVKAANESANSQAQQILEEAKKEAVSLVQKGKSAYLAWVEKGETEYLEKISQAEAEIRRIQSEKPKPEVSPHTQEKPSQTNLWW